MAVNQSRLVVTSGPSTAKVNPTQKRAGKSKL
jgi:hypothetical protein